MWLSVPAAVLTPPFGLLPRSLTFYLALMMLGFLISIWGHAAKSKIAVGIGIGLIFLATVVFPIAINVFNESPAPPGPNISAPGE